MSIKSLINGIYIVIIFTLIMSCSVSQEKEVEENLRIVINEIKSNLSDPDKLKIKCFGFNKGEKSLDGCYDFTIGIIYNTSGINSVLIEKKEFYGILRCDSVPNKYFLMKIESSSKTIEISCDRTVQLKKDLTN